MLLLSGIPVADAIMLAGILSDGEWFTGHFFFEMSVESPPQKKYNVLVGRNVIAILLRMVSLPRLLGSA